MWVEREKKLFREVKGLCLSTRVSEMFTSLVKVLRLSLSSLLYQSRKGEDRDADSMLDTRCRHQY